MECDSLQARLGCLFGLFVCMFVKIGPSLWRNAAERVFFFEVDSRELSSFGMNGLVGRCECACVVGWPTRSLTFDGKISAWGLAAVPARAFRCLDG